MKLARLLSRRPFFAFRSSILCGAPLRQLAAKLLLLREVEFLLLLFLPVCEDTNQKEADENKEKNIEFLFFCIPPFRAQLQLLLRILRAARLQSFHDEAELLFGQLMRRSSEAERKEDRRLSPK